MENSKQDIKRLEDELKDCRKLLTAIGDETRQHILCMMMEGECQGSRVVEIAQRTNLSRPAVSHHMQILKDAQIVKARKEGTYIYYYLDPDKTQIRKMKQLFADIERIASNAPGREAE